MKVKIKKLHPNAVIPKYAKKGDAGLDLTATERNYFVDDTNDLPDYIEYKTGLSIEIPEGYVGLLFPRSSNSKKDLYLANHVGVIDSGYRGEVTFRYKIDQDYDFIDKQDRDLFVYKQNDILYDANVYSVGDKVGQLIIIPYPQIEFEEVKELSVTDRGTRGYGSTGN
jgi:dUTP pyrophosphatase